MIILNSKSCLKLGDVNHELLMKDDLHEKYGVSCFANPFVIHSGFILDRYLDIKM